jgi:hypothetical protein
MHLRTFDELDPGSAALLCRYLYLKVFASTAQSKHQIADIPIYVR